MEKRKISRRATKCRRLRRPLCGLVKGIGCVFVSNVFIVMRFSVDCVGVSATKQRNVIDTERKDVLVWVPTLPGIRIVWSVDESNMFRQKSSRLHVICTRFVLFSFLFMHQKLVHLSSTPSVVLARALSHAQTHSLSPSPKHRHCLAMLIFCSDRGAQFLSFIDNQKATRRHFSFCRTLTRLFKSFLGI